MARLAALVGVITISFSAIFMRLASANPATAAFWRAAYALPVLIVAWLLVRSRDRRPFRSRVIAFVAGLFLALDLVLWQESIDRIGASLAVVLANLQVLFVGFLAWILHRERPTNTAFAVVPAVILGVVLISGLGRRDAYGIDPVAGVLFGVATAATYAGFLLLFRQSNRGHLAPTPGPLLDATLGAACGSLLMGLADPGFSMEITWPVHGWLLALGLLIQAFAWMLIAVALPRLPALETSVMLLLQPAGAIIWARLIFDEVFSVLQWMGIGLVLGGILILGRLGTVRDELRPESEAARPAT
jgi:drug/metabolite transporter (DMT)-like permease